LTVDYERLLKFLAEHPHGRKQPHGRDYFNPWYGDDAEPEQRRANLAGFLEARQAAPILLVAEAPGYKGCGRSGIPLTNPDPSVDGEQEDTARFVHEALAELGITDDVVMWNIFPFQPHKPGEIETNRSPSDLEAKQYSYLIHLFAPKSRSLVVAIGAKARFGLESAGIRAAHVRHPSKGGNRLFLQGLRTLIDEQRS